MFIVHYVCDMRIDPFLLLYLLIGITVFVSYRGFNNYSFFEQYKFQVTRILNGDKIRLLSSGFLHADWIHLILNMYVLYIFGKIVIHRFGDLPFLLVYFGSLLAGSLYSLYYHKKEPYYSAIGASGAVSGIVFSCILLHPQMKLNLMFIPIAIPGYIFGVLYLLYTIYGMKKQLGNIGHSAHLGGAIGGYLLTLIIAPWILKANLIFAIALAVPILILVLFGKKLKV